MGANRPEGGNMKEQGKRTRALDTRGRPVAGLYFRDSRYIAGWQENGRWRMQTLEASSLTDAKRERESLLSGLREGRIARRDGTTFGELFEAWQESRSISERTRSHEQHLRDRHLETLKTRRVQDIARRDLNRILKEMKETYSPWTCVAVHRIMVGVFALAVRDDILTVSPIDKLSAAERPRQRNAKQIERLDSATMKTLISAGATERWRAAFALAGIGALRIGELRALKWADISFKENTINVSRSLLPSGDEKGTKSEAGRRSVALFPEMRRLLVAWKLKSPRTNPEHYVVCSADGKPVQERNLRRALDQAKTKAKLGDDEKRLSWHSLRHSAGSVWLTE